MTNHVVVIGSGPCGAIAAFELVQRGITVTMLDAGARPVRGVIARAAGNTIFKWAEPGGLRTTRQVATGDPATEWRSSLSLGGLSNYWSGSVPRMAPSDFDEGARLDERFRWPISYDDLEPHYRVVEQVMRVTAGPPINGVPTPVATFQRCLPADWAAVVERAAAEGTSIGVMPMARGDPWMLALRPTGFSSFHCILKPLRMDPRFRLLTGAFAVGVSASHDPGAGVEVEYVDRPSGHRQWVAAQAVVIAAGTLDSTKLLLQSTSEAYPQGIGNSRGLVGRYLHDHLRQWWLARLDRPMLQLAHPIYIGRASHLHSQPLIADSLTIGMFGPKARVQSWYGGRSDFVGVQVLGTMVPREEHTVALSGRPPAPDPADDAVEICIRYDEQALDNMEAARSRFTDVFARAGLKATPEGPFHRIRPGSSVHYGGTIRMHADPAYGVLDRWNRVHDAPAVMVCDASCFTTGPEKNPTLTAMAIASRTAQRLAADVRSGALGVTK